MKMREWLDDKDTPGGLEMSDWMEEGEEFYVLPTDSPVLDAEVIGLPCPTCGGRGKRKDIWAGAVREVACPDCADTQVWVIAPEAMEAAAKALLAKIREQDDGTNLDYHDLPGFYAWEDCTEEGREQWRDVTRVALEAAGIVVADEVVEVGAGWGALAICNEGLELVHEGGTDRQEDTVNPGDTIYIVRATVTGCDKED